eukprot:1172277-Prymnesium_polylepis.4
MQQTKRPAAGGGAQNQNAKERVSVCLLKTAFEPGCKACVPQACVLTSHHHDTVPHARSTTGMPAASCKRYPPRVA